MHRLLTTFLVAVMLLVGVLGFATVAPDTASEVPVVEAFVADSAEASTGAFVHRHFMGTGCNYSTGAYYYYYHWHYPDGRFFWLETVVQPGYTCI